MSDKVRAILTYFNSFPLNDHVVPALLLDLCSEEHGCQVGELNLFPHLADKLLFLGQHPLIVFHVQNELLPLQLLYVGKTLILGDHVQHLLTQSQDLLLKLCLDLNVFVVLCLACL